MEQLRLEPINKLEEKLETARYEIVQLERELKKSESQVAKLVAVAEQGAQKEPQHSADVARPADSIPIRSRRKDSRFF